MSFTTRPDAVAGTPAAALQTIRNRSEEEEGMEDMWSMENENEDETDLDDGMQIEGLFSGVTPFCDGEVPAALTMAMAEAHQGAASKQINANEAVDEACRGDICSECGCWESAGRL